MPIIETVVIRRRIPIDPAAPVIPHAAHAWDDEIRRVDDVPPLPPANAPVPAGNGTLPTNIPGAVTQWAGPYALPISEISIGAFFAVYQIQHVVDRVMPGAAQLWPANGSGPMWNVLAALVGLGAAIHGIYGVFKVARAKKKMSPA